MTLAMRDVGLGNIPYPYPPMWCDMEEAKRFSLTQMEPAKMFGLDLVDAASAHVESAKHRSLGLCKVCGDEATGMYFGALVCVPCKTFFLRYAGDQFAFVCKKNRNCEITITSRTQCKFCRYQKCLSVGMCRKERPATVQLSEGQQLCVVCQDLANGVHFGAITCEGCKKFFRRGLTEHKSYTCKVDKKCIVNPRTRNACRYCRFQKCIESGMSREAIQMGRPSKIKYPSDSSSAPKAKVPHLRDERGGIRLSSSALADSSLSSPTASSSVTFPSPVAEISRSSLPPLQIKEEAVDYDILGRMMEGSSSRTNLRHSGPNSMGDGYLDMCPVTSTNEPSPISPCSTVDNQRLRPDQQAYTSISPSPNSQTKCLDSSPYQAISSASTSPWSAYATSPQDNSQTTPYTQDGTLIGRTTGQYTATQTTATYGNPDYVKVKVENSSPLSTCPTSPCVPQSYSPTGHQQSYSPTGPPQSFSPTGPPQSYSPTGPGSRQSYSPTGPGSRQSYSPPGPGSQQSYSPTLPTTSSEVPIHHNVSIPHNSSIYNILRGASQRPMTESQAALIQEAAASLAASVPSVSNHAALQAAAFQHVSSALPMPCAAAATTTASEQSIQKQNAWSVYHVFQMAANGLFETKKEDISNQVEDIKKTSNSLNVPARTLKPILREDEDPVKMDVTRCYWQNHKLPDENIIFLEDHWKNVDKILTAYDRFVQTGAELNVQLGNEFARRFPSATTREKLAQSGQSLLPDYIEERVVRMYTLSSVKYCGEIPGFSNFDLNDQYTIVRLGQSQSRILVAAVHWYDPEKGDFKDFLSWRAPDYTFKRALVDYCDKIHKLKLDKVEAALLNVLVLIATDYPDLKNPEVIEEMRMNILKSFRAYTTALYGSPNKRIEELFSYVPALRELGVQHHHMTFITNLNGCG